MLSPTQHFFNVWLHGFYNPKWENGFGKAPFAIGDTQSHQEKLLWKSPPAGGWAWKFPSEQVRDRQRASWGGVGRERSGGRRGVNGPK